jgi:hypothetical protein
VAWEPGNLRCRSGTEVRTPVVFRVKSRHMFERERRGQQIYVNVGMRMRVCDTRVLVGWLQDPSYVWIDYIRSGEAGTSLGKAIKHKSERTESVIAKLA